EGHEGEDVDGRVFPGCVEAGELGVSADELRAGDGEAAEVEGGGGAWAGLFGSCELAELCVSLLDLLAQGEPLGRIGNDRLLFLEEGQTPFPGLHRPGLRLIHALAPPCSRSW